MTERDREGHASSSASSSMQYAPPSKADRVVYRVYTKTVAVLVEARLTHVGSGASKTGDKTKEDKWFNLITSETEQYRPDLAIYTSISSSYRHPSWIPPLLIAFILDTSDLPNGQALLWNRSSGKVAVDMGMLAGKGKEKEKPKGIVLERWTFTASAMREGPSGPNATQTPPQAYRMGIIHFRSLFSHIRLLPAYRIYRRLRRANNGLRVGIKLWTPDNLTNTVAGINDAWKIMERDMVDIGTGLEHLVPDEEVEPERGRAFHRFTPLELFGAEYSLVVDYRSEVDFHVEDMEAVLSEKFVDMDEDFFTPTVARRRLDTEGSGMEGDSPRRSTEIPQGIGLEMSGVEDGTGKHERKHSDPAPIPGLGGTPTSVSPIPLRQGPATVGSFRGSLGRPSGSRVASGLGLGTSKESSGPGSLGRWGALGEGLPFAQGSPRSPSQLIRSNEPPSPSTQAQSGAMVTARRLSGHSIHPVTSPSTSLQRSTAAPQLYQSRPPLSSSKPSSIGRTSSFLSQAGRSYTSAQLASMGSPYTGQQYFNPGSLTPGSPPIIGTTSTMSITSPDPTHSGQGPASPPASLSFTKQPLLARNLSGRPGYGAQGIGSSYIPGSSFEREAGFLAGSPGAQPGMVKRYSSYSARKENLLGGSPTAAVGSQGSSGGGDAVLQSSGTGLGILRRSSTRTSQESGLRHSIEKSGTGQGGSGSRSGSLSGTVAKPAAEDSEDIEAFLKALDSLPQPPSVASHALQTSRSRLPSASSSQSNPSLPASPSPLHASSSVAATGTNHRARMTKAQVEDQLRKMAGSFQANTSRILDSSAPFASVSSSTSPLPRSGATSGTGTPAQGMMSPSVGLLTASRPIPSARRVSQPEEQLRRQSGPRQSSGSVKTGSPLSHEVSLNNATQQQQNLTIPTPAPARETDNGLVMTSSRTGGDNKNPPKPSARSLPGPGHASLQENSPPPLVANFGFSQQQPATTALSPQTTGGTTHDSTRSRRGPVLLRGGFGDTKAERISSKASVSSSPSHSPIRDMSRLNLLGHREKDREGSTIGGRMYGEKQAEEELDGWARQNALPGAVVPGVGMIGRFRGFAPAQPSAYPAISSAGDGSACPPGDVGVGQKQPGVSAGALSESRSETGRTRLSLGPHVAAETRDESRGRRGRVKSDGEDD